MKTVTYLRFSLLLPFVMWGLSLALFIALAALISGMNASAAFMDFTSAGDFGLLFLMFYVFGIVIWIFPYGLLALILLLCTFLGRAQFLIKLFALAPLAMMVLTVAVVILMDLGNPGVSSAFSSPGHVDQNFVEFHLMVAGLSLVWGYLCVGIGYGLYKLLQRRGFLRDEFSMKPAPKAA